MKQRLPGILCLLAAWVVCITAARHIDPIPGFVLRHEAALTTLAEEALAHPEAEGGFSGVRTIRVWPCREGAFVEFTTGYFPAITGFYYAPTGQPVPYQGADTPLTRADGGWVWEHLGNHGTTRHITGCWYAFEAVL